MGEHTGTQTPSYIVAVIPATRTTLCAAMYYQQDLIETQDGSNSTVANAMEAPINFSLDPLVVSSRTVLVITLLHAFLRGPTKQSAVIKYVQASIADCQS